MDHLMREMLTDIGGYDLCVTEFVRVVDRCMPARVFYRFCPELHQNGRTKAGTPVRVQLLGQEPSVMADNAAVAVELGSAGIDLNFGCPAKQVNKSSGGAALLKQPNDIFKVVDAVRKSVPREQPVSAKIRLGWDDTSLLEETVDAINQAGASMLTVHARTKTQGYRPPAHWHEISRVSEMAAMPVVANGDIVDAISAQQCMNASSTRRLMIGRGALMLPNAAQVVRGLEHEMPWHEVLALLLRYSEFEIEGDKGKYYPNRLKQWLAYLKKQYPEADQLFRQIRAFNKSAPIVAFLEQFNKVNP
ncbi:tRNA-dihydrouridine synthase [Echinimonas agarilytica]|uniref:tRNA-dihydrouridine(16) synthase n=2 Tax=Echinimonas agarilytica TaxID=1215918 RepID=A0AA41W6D8_9GAMM|nr:tRNA-dihydrouridine synthase [Echinimonas agarilytica]